MEATNLIECSRCKQVKPRTFKETLYRWHHGTMRPRHVYVDDRGKQWKSLNCPTCTSQKSIVAKKANAERLQPFYGPTCAQVKAAAQRTWKRKCRKCDKPLPPSKYFYHSCCMPVNGREEQDWGAAYHRGYEGHVSGSGGGRISQVGTMARPSEVRDMVRV